MLIYMVMYKCVCVRIYNSLYHGYLTSTLYTFDLNLILILILTNVIFGTYWNATFD